jgi:hypothetical protein
MTESEITAWRAVAWMQVTCCLLTDTTGENHCDHPPPPPVPRLRQLRWRLSSTWADLRLRVGMWIAGVPLERLDD